MFKGIILQKKDNIILNLTKEIVSNGKYDGLHFDGEYFTADKLQNENTIRDLILDSAVYAGDTPVYIVNLQQNSSVICYKIENDSVKTLISHYENNKNTKEKSEYDFQMAILSAAEGLI